MGPRSRLVILCIQNSEFSTGLTSLLWVPDIDLWFCGFKTETLGPGLQVSLVPRPHL